MVKRPRLKETAVKLLRRVKKHILEEPKRIDMGTWIVKEDEMGAYTMVPKRGFAACGTVGCIGGWVEILHRLDHPRSKADASGILGLLPLIRWYWDHDDGSDQPEVDLFFKKSLVYAKNIQTAAHAKAVAAHIDRFIKKWA